MEQVLTKKLKRPDGLPVPVGDDNPKSDAGGNVLNVSPGLKRDIDGLTGGSNGNTGADKAPRTNGTENQQISDIDVKVHARVNSSTEGEANETSSNVSDNAMPSMNFIGFVGSPCEKAGNTSDCVASAGAGTSSDGLALDERLLKRERRKQANRESARRSRLRKQAEFEELVSTWESLNLENMSLKSELGQLKDDSEKLRLENAALMEKLGCGVVSQEGERVSGKVEADLALPNNTENLLDCNTHEKSNPEAKLHLLLESSTRTDTVAAR
ncbi:Basic-leucine zipper transcription factor [Trema orientale]|uniref:Basic-leucine zipper transcription factor n=1 Tax=Trema orientale TaxID=63057 RepID=A0A2P5EAC2_TREOI|nr:Basic-leucine zipper transcription factor [Trema orientale]